MNTYQTGTDDFWVPTFKWQLVNWLRAHVGKGCWEHMKKKQLYAIYFKERRK